jgi:hypothetical protein
MPTTDSTLEQNDAPVTAIVAIRPVSNPHPQSSLSRSVFNERSRCPETTAPRFALSVSERPVYEFTFFVARKILCSSSMAPQPRLTSTSHGWIPASRSCRICE